MVSRLGKRSAGVAMALGLATAGVIGGGLRPTSGAVALPPGGGCVLAGTATFASPVKATPSSNSYTFSGTLTGCKGTTTVKSGTVTASGSGKLSCAEGATTGTASIAWNTGQTSSVSFSTTSAAAATLIKGTVTGGLFAGSPTAGAIAFETSTPQLCLSTGLTSLKFQGVDAVK
jgi:hypothetical protein